METQKERPIWKLDGSEQRQLIITFVGGLASIIVGGCVLGVAAVLARNEERGQGFTLIGLMDGTASLGTFLVLSFLFMSTVKSRLAKRIFQVALIAFVLLLTLAVLVWIGIAAGLH
jgi:hypothetical protein